jgi:hypothetical protein
LSGPGVLEQVFIQAGFVDVRSERLTSVTEFSSVEAYTNMLKDVAAPVVALLAGQPAKRQAEVFQAISDAARAYAAADASVRMPNEAICVVGRRQVR